MTLKPIFLIVPAIMLSIALTADAKGQSPSAIPESTRWHIEDSHSIRWDIGNDIPHYDHIEMSGEQVSVVYRYGVDENGAFAMERSIVWPMLRTVPNDTHASLTVQFRDSFTDGIRAEGSPLGKEKVEWIRLDGTLTVSSTFADGSGIMMERIYFPSPTRPAVCEKYTLTNTGNKPVSIEIPAVLNRTETDPEYGTEGSYRLIAATQESTDRSYRLMPGESVSFNASIQGLKTPQVEMPVDTDRELEERRALVSGITGTLVLDTPDPVLNTMFSFSKIRGSESIFRTRGGLMQSPGGEAYYAALWCNDQAEYINPFFPFLGYEKGNESALNSFLHFARYMNPEFNYIPWSIIAEGYDSLGAFDRGDAAMLAYGATRYALEMGEIWIAETLYPLITWSLEYCRRNLDGNGVVKSTADELELRFPAGDANLCTSSLYYDALLSAAWLEEEMDREYRKDGGSGKEGSAAKAESYRKQAAELKENIEKHFGCNMKGFETYRYYEGNDLLRSWICIPLVMDIFDRKEGTVKALLSPALWSENGVYTEEGTDVFWDRATLYALRGIYASGCRDEATTHIQEFSRHRLLGDHVPYAVEAWPEGNQRHLSTESALYCRIFTEGMFGFRPTGFRSFTLRPQLPDGWDRIELRGIHACSDQPFDIKVRRSGEKLTVTVSIDGKVSAKYRVSNGEQFSIDMENL